jgi:predicted N-formylglutamate amidohydrolase
MNSDPENEWPPAVEVLNENGASNFVLLCEHASNHIPLEYQRLGLDERELKRHIAWDIGAAGVARLLSAALDAPCFLSNYSRLLIDLNRPLGAESSIPLRSEATDIPGNSDISPAEVERRANIMFRPFHDAVAAHLDMRASQNRPTRLVTIHSFTPEYLGVKRPWHVGILYDAAKDFSEAILAGLRMDPALNAAANEPYVIARDGDYAIPIHGDDRGIDAALVEIRQDLISDNPGIREWADRIARALLAT